MALGMDVREGHFLDAFPRVFNELRAAGVAFEVLYLEASDDVLVRVRVASRVTLGADATAVRRFGGAGKHRAGVKALFHPAASGTVIANGRR